MPRGAIAVTRRAAISLSAFTAGLITGAGAVLLTLSRLDRGYRQGRKS